MSMEDILEIVRQNLYITIIVGIGIILLGVFELQYRIKLDRADQSAVGATCIIAVGLFIALAYPIMWGITYILNG